MSDNVIPIHSNTGSADTNESGHDPSAIGPNAMMALLEGAEGAGDNKRRDTCPIIPIGHREGRYYFLTKVGELRSLAPSDFTTTGLTSIMDGSTYWMMEHFPRHNKEGALIGFNNQTVAGFLMRECVKEGLMDPSMPVRGAGVWRSSLLNDQGTPVLIVHSGDKLWMEGQWQAAGKRIGHALYPSTPPVEAFDNTPSTPADGERLLRVCTSWNWKRRGLDASLFFGFLGQAMLGGAPPWRAHVIVNGMAGTGKSSLGSLASSVLGAAAHPQTNNYTEAGLRQALSGEARCLVLDEAEAEEGQSRILRVVEMLRHMSGGDGVKALRGSTGGHAQGFALTGCALLLSILRVPLKPQDRSRILPLSLNPIENPDPAAWIQVKAEIAAMIKLSPRFRCRMVQRWAQYLATVDIYRGHYLAQGVTPRGADQIASLMAGRHTLLYDSLPDENFMQSERIDVAGLMEEEKMEGEDNEGTQCLNHLYSTAVDFYRSGERQTLGQMIIRALNPISSGLSPEEFNKQLTNYGVKVIYGDGPGSNTPLRILVARKHSGLDKIFAGTRWQSGGWVGALEYLGGDTIKNSVRFGGAVTRVVAIEELHWPRENNEGEGI